MNEVDRLRERATQIQRSCEHKFQIEEEPEWAESLVQGVFVGVLAGPARVSLSRPQFTLMCPKCSKREATNVHATCPKCLSPMGKAKCLGAGSREQYFGQEYSYYSAAIAVCTGEECHFAVACDEWDQ